MNKPALCSVWLLAIGTLLAWPAAADDAWYGALCGLWRAPLDEQRQLYEHWWFVDGELRGRSWLSVAGEPRAAEHLRLENLAGASRYVATPPGQDTTVFHAAADRDPAARRWINPQHDFPQVIRYRLMADELEARIANLDDGARDDGNGADAGVRADENTQAGRSWLFQRLRPCQANTEEH